MPDSIGTIHSKDALFLRNAAGDLEGDGRSYELTYSMIGTPIVRSQQTGKWFTLNWQQILDLAIAAGIDEP